MIVKFFLEKKVKNKFIKGFFFSILVLLFCSCSNNFYSEDTDSSRSIEDSSANLITILADENTGVITSESEVNCVRNASFTSVFTLNSDEYVFSKWIAVSKEDGSSRDYCVSMEEAYSEENDEYSVTVTVLKVTNDIVIKPLCYLIPKVESYFPQCTVEDQSYPQDTSIRIIFNKKVHKEDFIDETTGKIKNIIITSGGINLNKYYENPELSDDGKTLTIKVKKDSLIIPNVTLQSFKDITVKVNTIFEEDALTDDVENENVQFNKNTLWTYRINNTVDRVAPEVVSTNLYRKKSASGNFSNTLTLVSWDECKNTDIVQNHVGDTVYFSFNGADEGGGIAGVDVYEQMICTTEGEPVELTSKGHIENLDIIKEDGKYVVTGEYKIGNEQSGVVNLSFRLYDYSDNFSSSIDTFVVKDTAFSDETLRIYNTAEDPNTLLWDGISKVWAVKDGEVFTTKSFKYNLSYGTSETSMTSVKLASDKATNCMIKNDGAEDLFIKLTATDDFNNKASITRVIPGKKNIVSHIINKTQIEKPKIGLIASEVSYKDCVSTYSFYCTQNNSYVVQNSRAEYEFDYPGTLGYQNYQCQIINQYGNKEDFNRLYGPLGYEYSLRVFDASIIPENSDLYSIVDVEMEKKTNLRLKNTYLINNISYSGKLPAVTSFYCYYSDINPEKKYFFNKTPFSIPADVDGNLCVYYYFANGSQYFSTPEYKISTIIPKTEQIKSAGSFIPTVTYNPQTLELEIKGITNVEYSNTFVISLFNEEENEWREILSHKLTDISYSENLDTRVLDKNLLYRVNIVSRDLNGDIISPEVSLYIFIPYYIGNATKNDATDDVICIAKNLKQKNSTSVKISADKKTFVHTIKSDLNYGKSIDEWERFGTVINPVTSSESFEYQLLLDEVENGEYYVIIAHYADGSSLMSDVNKK